MVDVDVAVEAVARLFAIHQAVGRLTRHRRSVTADDARVGELAIADGDAAGESAVVAMDAVVGDLGVVVPAVQEDRPATLGAVDDTDAIDARGVAEEVAGSVVAPVDP